jgi:hypothetical protein
MVLGHSCFGERVCSRSEVFIVRMIRRTLWFFAVVVGIGLLATCTFPFSNAAQGKALVTIPVGTVVASRSLSGSGNLVACEVDVTSGASAPLVQTVNSASMPTVSFELTRNQAYTVTIKIQTTPDSTYAGYINGFNLIYSAPFSVPAQGDLTVTATIPHLAAHADSVWTAATNQIALVLDGLPNAGVAAASYSVQIVDATNAVVMPSTSISFDAAGAGTVSSPLIGANIVQIAVPSGSGTTVLQVPVTGNNSISSAKAITGFTFSSLGVSGVITGTTIAVPVPIGTSVSALVPTITTTGVSVSPASGVAQDFTNTVTYTVTAADSSTQSYVVTVTPQATVTYDSQGADVSAAIPSSQTVVSPANTVGSLPINPVKSGGWFFNGWYTAPNGGGTQFLATTPLTGNITVYAYWTVS